MGFNRDDNRSGGYRGGFSRGGDRGGFRGGRSSFGGGRGFGGDRGPREMFKTTCSNCGKECEVPFRPTNGKPVYCSECFEKMGNGGRSDTPSRPSFDQKAQFDALSAKLDRIISLLEPKIAVSEPASVENSGEVKEVKAPKVKKVAKKSDTIKK